MFFSAGRKWRANISTFVLASSLDVHCKQAADSCLGLGWKWNKNLDTNEGGERGEEEEERAEEEEREERQELLLLLRTVTKAAF